MSLVDGLVALGVILVVVYMVLVKMMKNNPNMAEHIRGLFRSDNKPISRPRDQVVQIYDDRRTLM